MENNNSDWMAVQTQAGDASFADIYNLGVDPSAVTLDTKETYKEAKKIKENPAFQTAGKFDDKKFDQFYDMSVKTLNAYKNSDYSIATGEQPDMPLWEDSNLARRLKQKTFRDPISLKTNTDPERNLKIAQKSNLGLIQLNEWSDPQKSLAEVAQGQKVIDGRTGKELKFTPQDNGFGNAFGFFNEPLVLAAYDNDIKDEKGNIIHKRGETKFDAKGLPRYETLAGRNASGKQVLSRFDTLTKEDSFVNKFDFMDSDDIKKSLGGSIMKAAVTVAPLLVGGPVALAARSYFIADGLLQAGTEIGKALDGIINGKDAANGSFYKAMNGLQAFSKQWKGGTSEYGRDNFFSAESILNLATDSVFQLKGQQALAMWPQRIKQYQMAKELNLNPSLLKALEQGGDEALDGVSRFENYIAKYGEGAGKAAIAMSKNMKQLQNMQKTSELGARVFMAATSAVGISDVADQAGLNARDKGLLYLGYTAGLMPLFAANIGHIIEGHSELDEFAHGLNAATKNYAAEYLTPVLKTVDDLADDAAKAAAKESLTGIAKFNSRAIDMMLAGKKLGARVAERFNNVNTPLLGALAEGTEEITEQMLQDGVSGVYNGLSSLGLTSTDNKQIAMDPGDMMSAYGQAFIGGALGGFVFKLADPEIKIKPFLSKEMKEYVANGYGDDVLEQIKDMHAKGQLGSTQLSIKNLTNADGVVEKDVWAPVNADNPVSQNDFIADRMIKEVKANLAHLDAFGLRNPDTFVDGKNKFYDAIVDTRTDTDFRDRIRGASDKIVEISNEISALPETDLNADALKKKKEELKEAKEEFAYLSGDESVDEYFRQGLFNTNADITTKFGVKSRQSFTESIVGKNAKYETLNEENKNKVDDAFNEYRMSNDDTNSIKVDLRNARLEMENFDTDMKENKGYEAIENFNKSIVEFGDYGVEGKGLIDGKASEHTLLDLSEQYYEKMDKVQYVPDFIHDKITGHLDELKRNGLNEAIDTTFAGSTNALLFRKMLLNKGIKNLNASTPIDGLLKEYLTKFKPLTVFDSPAYQTLKNSGDDAGLSSMIKVLSEVDGINDNSAEKQDFLFRNKVISENITPDQARAIVMKIAENEDYDIQIQDFFAMEHPESVEMTTGDIPAEDYETIVQMLRDIDFESILLNEQDHYVPDGESALRLLRNINKQKFLSDATGIVKPYEFGYLVDNADNVIVDHALTGMLNDEAPISTLKAIDEQVDELTGKLENSLKEKASSPLATFLSDVYRFKDTEFETLRKNGASNYLNSSDDYEKQINEHIAKTEKVHAYLLAMARLNPIINDWRKNHEDIVPEKLRKEELTILSPLAYGTIYDNSTILLNELKYLKDLNTFNKNNTLGNLLKEDGKQLASAVRSLQVINNSNPNINNLLPEINEFVNDPIILDYISDVNLATEEKKIAAIGAAAGHEQNIYNKFQSYSADVKQSLIDQLFNPIDSGSFEYRTPVDFTGPLSKTHETLYLAKILGSPTVTYTKAVAGEQNPDGFAKITAAPMDPFPNQEAAIRLAYLSRYGDPVVYGSLANAFSFKNMENPPSTFKRGDSAGIDTTNILTVVGDPGVGKTKVIMAGVLSFDDGYTSDTVLLGSVNEHVVNLSTGVINAGYENRINKELMSNVNDFINKLELTDKNDKLVTIDNNTPEILTKLEKLPRYTKDYESDQKMEGILRDVANTVLDKVKLWEDDSSFNKILAKKLKGVRNIVIDEFTHANPVDLAILTHIVSEYNKSINNDPKEKISIILAGDNNQLGFSTSGMSRTFGEFVSLPTSLPLTTSLRSGWDLVNHTLIEVKDRTSQLNDMTFEEVTDPATDSRLKAIPIRLAHTFANGSPIGIYRQEVTGETGSEHLAFFSSHVDAIKATENSLVYVVGNESKIGSAEALLRNMLGSEWSKHAQVLSVATTQGREFKYAIIDAAPQGGSKEFDTVNAYKFLNTILSRATEATLLIDKGTYDKHTSFVQLEVPSAIDQKRLTDEMITSIKDNRQKITAAIVVNPEGSVATAPSTPTAAPTVTGPVQGPNPAMGPYPSVGPTFQAGTPQSAGTPKPTGPETNPNEPELPPDNLFEDPPLNEEPPVDDAPPVDPSEPEVAPDDLFEDKTAPAPPPPVNNPRLPVLGPEDGVLLSNATGTADENLTDTSEDLVLEQKYVVNAYTTFTFKRDVDSVRALTGKAGMSDAEAEGELMKLRENSVYGVKEFGSNYFTSGPLAETLAQEGYRLKDTTVRIRAVKRDASMYTVGRAKWKNTYNEQLDEDLLLVEGIIPSKNGNRPFVYTLGTFNSFGNILKFGGKEANVKAFVDAAKAGLAANKEWKSPEFTMKEWQAMTNRKDFKIEFAPGTINDFDELKGNYNKNMYITEPHVVIAKPDDESNTLADWKKLSGQSVAFATEHLALRGKSPEFLYEVYKKQLEYFNTPEFKAMNFADKQAYIETLPKITGTEPALSPRPRLVGLIRLTNPKHNFVEFIVNYNVMVDKAKKARASGGQINRQEEVAEFEMSPYVADRLVKSMMVIHRMLTDKDAAQNKEWFQKNVMDKVKQNVLTQIQSYMDQTIAQERAEGRSENFFGTLKPEDFVSNETDTLALRSIEEFADALDKYLYGNDKLVKGVYKTDSKSVNKIKGIDLSLDVDLRGILPDELTTDKRKDFSGGLMNVRNLAIYNGLKGSFLKMVNESLIALGSISPNADVVGKYSLSDVFSKGLIENVIIAGVGTNGRKVTNVIAPVKRTSLTKGFTSNIKSIQSAGFVVDFNMMTDKINEMSKEDKTATDRAEAEERERIAIHEDYHEIIAASGIDARYKEYQELMFKTFKSRAEMEAAVNAGFTGTFKPDAKVTAVADNYYIDSLNPANNSSFDKGINRDPASGFIALTAKADERYVTLVVDRDNSVETITFDRNNDYNRVSKVVFKQTEASYRDLAKQIIDGQNLNLNDLIDASRKDLIKRWSEPDVAAKDFSSLKGQTVQLIDPGTRSTDNEATYPVKIIASGIGPDGTWSTSHVTVLDSRTGERVTYPAGDFEYAIADKSIVPNLPTHNRAIEKVEKYLSDPNNVDIDSRLNDIVDAAHPDMTGEDIANIVQEIMNIFGKEEAAWDDDAEESISTYDKILEMASSATDLIVNPFSEAQMTPEVTKLVDAYTRLAKGVYADSLHVSNGFINNFSIFANGEWENYQKTINESLADEKLMSNPVFRKKVLKLEEQLNKLTHDC